MIFEKMENIKKFNHFTSSKAVCGERFHKTVRDLLKKPVFEKDAGNQLNGNDIVTQI